MLTARFHVGLPSSSGCPHLASLSMASFPLSQTDREKESEREEDEEEEEEGRDRNRDRKREAVAGKEVETVLHFSDLAASGGALS